MQTIRWTEEATTDLVEIIDYIDQRNSLAADALHSMILRAVEGLSSAPYLFRPGRVSGSRECVVHPNYIVIYQIGEEHIDVLRILHSRQKYP